MKFSAQLINAAVFIFLVINCVAAQDTTSARDTLSNGSKTTRPDSAGVFNLLSFTGTNSSGQNVLTWKTDYRANYTHFTLEHSLDAIQFSALGEVVQPAGSKTNSYTYTDSKPAAGRNYYRLKMTDAGGTITYSSITVVNNTPAMNLQIQYEAGSGTVAITGIVAGNVYQLKIYNSSGQLQLQKAVSSEQASVSISQLMHGLYVVYITDGVAAPVSRKIIW